MPPRKKAATSSNSRPRRSTRQTRKLDHDIPDVYEEMLAEAATDNVDKLLQSSRPNKRRKVGVRPDDNVDALFESPPPPPPLSPELLPSAEIETIRSTADAPSSSQQIVYDDFDGSDESDVEFEDVELDPMTQSASDTEEPNPKSLEIDLNKPALETPKRTVQIRKPITKAERLMRLDVHKWHLMSLIAHGLYRNSWCNNEEVLAVLKPIVSRKVIKLLHTDESEPKYQRNYSFNKGIEEICALWRQEWRITIPGLRRAYWREDVDAIIEVDEQEDLDLEDFVTAAQTRSGSRDLGAQLFTALLRSVAVEARLVFSLQVLPFTGSAKAETPKKTDKASNYIQAPAQNYGVSAAESSPFAPPSRTKRSKTKKIIDSPYPIFWTEVLTPNQTWISLDPLVRNTISKPKTQFEPPWSDALNNMAYVVAYEDDDSVKDVTRRYTQWYNAKTRKFRVDATKNGETWYSSALAVFGKRFREPRDEMEDAELLSRANSEGMPHNVQDFKGHPVYVLERHLRTNEVLNPKREVGKMNVGTAKNGKIESVYRRRDVHLCRTADAWYRRGRDVKVAEQPLKVVQPKLRKPPGPKDDVFSDDEDREDENEGVGLYAEYQTNVYEPPPVVDDKIPKNAYGNLDVYVPSMIPAGAIHILHTLAASAARLIGVDFADAVVGFEFKGRQGTAVIKGIVTAEKFTAAIASVIDGLESIGSEEVQLARTAILQSIWKRMLQALRVRQHIETEYGSKNVPEKPRNDDDSANDDDDDDDSAYKDEEEDMDVDENEDIGGGFVPEDEPTEEKVQDQEIRLQALKSKAPMILPDEVVRTPISITRSPHKLPRSFPDEVDNNDDLFEEEDGQNGGPSTHETPSSNDETSAGGFLVEDQDDTARSEGGGGGGGGGGFLPEDVNEQDEASAGEGGGFIPKDHDPSTSSPTTTTKVTSKPRPKPKSKPHPTIADTIHSDTEEDTALQQAIANSLFTPTRQDAPSTSPPSNPVPILIPTTNQIPDDTINDNDNDVPANENPTTTDANSDRKITSTSVSTPTDPPQRQQQQQQQQDPTTKTSSSSSFSPQSNESLLSHDPNEDDEEPDWLNDALDD